MKDLDFNIEDRSIKTNFEITKDELSQAQEDIIKKKESLQGVTNTEEVIHEYEFTAANKLDYSASIANDTTITVSELPSNTIAIHVNLRLSDTGRNIFLICAPTYDDSYTVIGDISREDWAWGVFADGGNNGIAHSYWIKTSGNQFYCRGVTGNNVIACYIKGYKVKA